MKKISKFMSVILTVALVASLFVTVNVSAAMQTVPLDWSDIVTYSFDITVPEGDILGIEFTAPCNTASLANLGWSYGSGSIKIAGGKIQAGKHWLASDNENIVNPCTDFPAGQANNLMVRKNHRTGYTEFIANGVSFCTTYVDNKTLPITMLNIHGSGAATSTITNVFTKGTDVGELGTVAEFDADNKTITVRFTEPLAAEADLSTTVLRKTNTTASSEDVALTVESDGRTAVFSYEAALDTSTEYAVILPDGLTGALGGTIKDYPAFTTDGNTLYQECNYNNGSATIWKDDKKINIYDSGEPDHDKVLPIMTLNETGNYSKDLLGLKIPESNLFSISFDVKVLVDSIKMGWTLWQQGGKTVTLGYGSKGGTTNYTILQVDNKNVNAGWLGDDMSWQTKIGTYAKNQWINYRMVFNRTDKTVAVYVDGVHKATKSIGADVMPSQTTFFFGVVGESAPKTVETQFVWMDNFEVNVIDDAVSVSDVTFVDGKGTETGAMGEISRLLDKVNVKFSSAMTDDIMKATTVSLYYDAEEITCERTYDNTTKTYTMSPVKLPPANAEVKVVVGGAANAYETSVTAGDEADDIVVYEIDAVDETDVKPLNGNLTTTKRKYTKYYPIMRAANFTDADQEITLIAAEYTVDGILNGVNLANKVTLKSGEYIRYGGKLNGENVIQAKTDTSYIKIFAWDSVTGGIHPMNTKPATVIKNY